MKAGAQPRQRRSARSRPRAPASPARATPGSLAWLAWPLILGYGVLLIAVVWNKAGPWWILPASAGLSLLAFFAYWQDKHAAQRGHWRTPETTLHLWSLAGGWPGAWLAQQVLRHKSSKRSFLATYWLTAFAHIGAVAGWLYWTLRA